MHAPPGAMGKCASQNATLANKELFRVPSHLPVNRRELLNELFIPRNCEKRVYNLLLNFSIYVKVDQIANVNVLA